ncbi:phosphopentomutase [Mesorhizobium sp. NBSH29]|uniref:phosphopentomutase n=1 Tax=Mesorhizobium sp. NBSH29 TaxID=2654249 RepID=UPI0018965E1C|nr:phosphopentomutase [Mesorhizobium sp. NBSH29]QPC86545.1 phosphopentomutase [Mesorhizobium sp. NBSH29]
MKRAFVFVLDSFGVGGAADAQHFRDEGANTFLHIAAACASGRCDREGVRAGRLCVPNMTSLGIQQAADRACSFDAGFLAPAPLAPSAFFGASDEISSGKDTPSGHWEIAGVPVLFDWGYFPNTIPTFPHFLTEAIIKDANLPGILGNRHASGTEIIAELGGAHMSSGKPILYTSADSVLQIAAHEEHFGLERLYELCLIARRLVDPLNIGRVIARPFVGDSPENFERTANRRDFSVPPPEPTVLDRLTERGSRVIGIGKIGDIFAHRGVSEVRKGAGNMALFDAALDAMADAGDGDLVFANFVDFDSLYGHRRDVAGYAAALEAFDRRIPEALVLLQPGDLFLLTADHGCDPSWPGTEHTRERVPIFGIAKGNRGGPIGLRSTFSDIGQTVAEHLGMAAGPHGTSFYPSIAADA